MAGTIERGVQDGFDRLRRAAEARAAAELLE
jgi:hypothetical protein